MLFLHDSTDTHFEWHKTPLYETKKAIVRHVLNGNYQLILSYPITNSNDFIFLNQFINIRIRN